ncbi:hypothetical protein RB623_01160 [Mesorhizobium sp. LHD-90]|uniref:hypothetical protein n=1 Tax=Mesorhizobium sp. LHD-90 TaxID=3071414 RepID=UPI0027DF889B|nr:hypothetical protein [Mesorhizobium sp. LHD-90]MDQ6432659.1 hypothetical protein [Mesorhizobium sp. LHD-90]
MAATRTARPVSGEIMTAAASRRAAGPPGDVVDAEFEVVGERQPMVPPRSFRAGLEPGMDFLAAKSTPDRPGLFGRPGGALFWTGGGLLALLAFWISGGHALMLPQAGAPSPGAAFTLTDISSRVDASGTRPVLLVDGQAGNDGAVAGHLPGLEIHVAGLDGKTTRYKLGTFARQLDPGERFAFSSRLDAPRNGVRSVSVTFAE